MTQNFTMKCRRAEQVPGSLKGFVGIHVVVDAMLSNTRWCENEKREKTHITSP
jgi:hypothetical protein